MRSRVCVLVVVSAAVLAAGCKKKKKAGGEPSASPTASASPSASATPEPTPSASAPAPDPALVARGQYLATAVAGCVGCHTPMGPQGPDMAKMFAGGMEFPEKWGTWRSPNITQDKKTGIGDWSDEAIATVIREGKRPDGSMVIPMMPYMRYNAMSDDDVKAVVAFLRTLPAVENTVAGNKDLKLPPMPPMPKPAGTAPAADPVEQGKYLANLMLCADCHPPMPPDGMMPDMKNEWAGGMEWDMWPPGMGTGKTVSANITSDKKTGIGEWAEADIVTLLTTGKKKDGTMVGPPMVIFVPLWSQLKPDDVANVAKFIKSIPPIERKNPKSTFKPGGPPPGGAPPAGGPPPAEQPKG